MPLRLLLWLPLALPAFLLTSGTQSCEPAWPMLLGLLLLTAALFELGVQDEGPRGRLLRMSAIAVVALAPSSRMLTHGGMPSTRDGGIHLWNAWSAAKALVHGDLWPRWLDTVGLGLPVGQFYPPLAYAAAALPIAAGLEPQNVMVLVGWTTGVLGGVGVYAVLRDLEWERAVSLLTAILFIIAPYRLFDLNYRFALGELIGLALVLPFWHLCQQVVRGRTGPVFRYPLPTVWVVGTVLTLSHPQSTVMAGLLLVVMLPWTLWRAGVHRTQGAARLLGAGALVVATTAFHMVPAMVEQDEVSIKHVIPHSARGYATKGLVPTHALHRRAWSGIREDAAVRDRSGTSWGLQRDYGNTPFYIGWTLIGSLPLLAITAIRRRETPSHEVVVMGVAAVAAWASTTPWVAMVMGNLSVLHPLQFPWRFLGPLTVAGVVLLGAWFRPLLRDSRMWAPVILAVFAWDSAPGFGAASWLGAQPEGSTLSWYLSRSGPPTCTGENLGFHAVRANIDQLLATPPAPGRTNAPRPLTEGQPWAGYPTGDLPTRIIGAIMPPRSLDVDVANVNPVPAEFFTERTKTRFWDQLRDGELGFPLLDAGVELQLPRRAGKPTHVRAWPRVRLRVDDVQWGLAARVERRSPREVTLHLPEGVPAGRLTFVEQDFPGWSVRLGQRAWRHVRGERGLLGVDIPEGTTRVQFRYAAATDARSLSLLVSLFGLLAGIWLAAQPFIQRR